MTAYSSQTVHRERVLQNHLIERLVAGEGYEQRFATTDFDRSLAMDRALVVRFIQHSQPEAWDKLVQHYAASAEDTLFTQLVT